MGIPLIVNASKNEFEIIMGIESGDTFDFILEDYYSSDPDGRGYRISIKNGSDDPLWDGQMYLQEGDEFTLRITETTPVDQYGENNFHMDHMIDFKGKSYTTFSSFSPQDEFWVGTYFLISCDWEFYDYHWQNLFDKYQSNLDIMREENPDADLKLSNSIINNEKEMGYRTSAEYNFPINDENNFRSLSYVFGENNVVFDKSTGVKLYSYSYLKSEYQFHDNESSTIKEKSLLKQVGYTYDDGSENVSLDIDYKFEIFLCIPILICLRKKYLSHTSFRKKNLS